MEKELSRTLQGIKEKTGILVQASTQGGEIFASTMPEYLSVDDSVFSSPLQIIQEDGKTYFKFLFGGQSFVGVISGDGESEKKYASLIGGYVGLSENKPKQLSYDEQLALILSSNFTKSRTMEFINEYSIPKSAVFVTIINTDGSEIAEVIELLSSFYGANDSALKLSQTSCALITFVDTTSSLDSVTPIKQAEILKRSLFEELGKTVKVFVGSTVKNFLDVSKSYEQAKYAEKCAEILGGERGVYAYNEFLLNKIFEDLSDDKLEEYLSSLSLGSASEIFKDRELIETGDCFLRNDLNVSETAREMYIHRNTLIYRLEKIEKLTGLDIKKFSDAVNFKVLYNLYLVKKV